MHNRENLLLLSEMMGLKPQGESQPLHRHDQAGKAKQSNATIFHQLRFGKCISFK